MARRAGHSLTVLFRFHARILRGRQSLANQLIEKGLSGGTWPGSWPTHGPHALVNDGIRALRGETG
ncbi:integrase [Streptomyces sp. URMC 125]|uniref:integrase n=1 Tax=Streptomyces sp. URMC 125 TaxID=3423419 RepID=UPI003F1BCE46